MSTIEITSIYQSKGMRESVWTVWTYNCILQQWNELHFSGKFSEAELIAYLRKQYNVVIPNYIIESFS